MRMAIACGGTGGHLFPGLAVAEELRARGCRVTLLISPKEVDQQGVKGAVGMEILTLPAVALKRGGEVAFLRGFIRSYRSARRHFQLEPPAAALAMGGFTSAPPILAARSLGALSFLHESNSVPGRANRWLSWIADRAFLGFPSAAQRLHTARVTVSGTPVRAQFQPREAATCRTALGLDPRRPVVLVMGGSQGASGINNLVMNTLPGLTREERTWQWFHLAGSADVSTVRSAYAQAGTDAVVHPFFAAMELALGAATVAVGRAGASSLAELAAVGVPTVLIPYPAATDDHQWHNARAFETTDAARALDQKSATPSALASALRDLAVEGEARARMQTALARWRAPAAARDIAEAIIEACGRRARPRADDSIPKTVTKGFVGKHNPPGCPLTTS